MNYRKPTSSGVCQGRTLSLLFKGSILSECLLDSISPFREVEVCVIQSRGVQNSRVLLSDGSKAKIPNRLAFIGSLISTSELVVFQGINNQKDTHHIDIVGDAVRKRLTSETADGAS